MKKSNVVDIRTARIKRLAAEFFRELDVPVPDEEVLPMAFSFIDVLRDSGQIPTEEIQKLVEKHVDLMNLLDALRSEYKLSHP